jgi:hypothetical protein
MEKRVLSYGFGSKSSYRFAAGDFKRKIIYLGYTIPYERIASAFC